MSEPSTTYTQPLPCDRGVAGNYQSRGWHHFEVGPNGVACCRYCGLVSGRTLPPAVHGSITMRPEENS